MRRLQWQALSVVPAHLHPTAKAAFSTQTPQPPATTATGAPTDSTSASLLSGSTAVLSSMLRQKDSSSGPGPTGKQDGVSKVKGEALVEPVAKGSVLRLLSLLKPEKGPLAVAVGTLLATTGTSLVLPAAIGHILDISLAPTSGSYTPTTIALGLFGLFAVQSVFIGVRTGLMAVAGERIATRIRRDMFSSLLDQEIGYFDANRTGDLINRLTSDTVLVQKSLTGNISSALRSTFMAVGGSAMLVYMSPELALLSLAVIPPVAVVGVLYGRYAKRRQKMVQAALGKTMEAAEELVANIRTVRTFAQEAREKVTFASRVEESYLRAKEVALASAWFEAVVHLAANVSLLTVLGYGGSLVLDGGMTAGELTAFLVYSLYVGINFGQLSSVYGDIMRAAGAASRIFEVQDRVPQLPVSGGQVLESIKGHVTFENVSFSYPLRPDAPVLSGLSLDIEPGKVVSIVGGSGSGKSTLGALLCRLYDVSSGSIKLDGVDIRDLDPQWLRRNIGVVSQEPVLFACSIEDNIRYANPTATDDEVRRAADIANASSFIEHFPDGYKTLVGERGVQLSGGQKQRVAIARLVLKNPPIVLLDEATSALDSESEYLVQEALTRVMAGRTVLSIAHRLSTIKAASSMAVIQDGRIVERGSFDELTATSDTVFSELVHRQLLK